MSRYRCLTINYCCSLTNIGIRVGIAVSARWPTISAITFCGYIGPLETIWLLLAVRCGRLLVSATGAARLLFRAIIDFFYMDFKSGIMN